MFLPNKNIKCVLLNEALFVFQTVYTTIIVDQNVRLFIIAVDYVLSYTALPAKSDSNVMFCLQLLSKTLTCTLHLSQCESIDHVCINPILPTGLIHKDLSIPIPL